MMIQKGDGAGPVIDLEVDFRAPRDKIYKTWTDAELVQKWFVPSPEFRNTLTEINLKEFGSYTLRLDPKRGGQPTIFHGHFIEIEPEERLAYSWTGGPMADYWTLVTARFLDRDEGSRVRLTHGVFEDAEGRDAHEGGWLGCLGGLADLLGEEFDVG